MVRPAPTIHPFDDPENWAKGDFTAPPWSQEQIRSFQRRIDSAFGAENAIVLVWSGDRSYGDVFLEDGKLVRKPVLLFGEYPVGSDYLYIVPPRWCLMEVHHGSQLTDWEESSWLYDEDGGKTRIRPETPPKFYYVHLKNGVLASHEQPTASGVPPCCERMWRNGRRICYGKYREPDDRDIAMVGEIRKAMDEAGVAQRPDTERDARTVQAANLATKHFMQRAAYNRAVAAKNMILTNPSAFLGDILEKRGSTMSELQVERIVKQALEDDLDERFSKENL